MWGKVFLGFPELPLHRIIESFYRGRMDSISQEMVQTTPLHSAPTCCQRTREERAATASPSTLAPHQSFTYSSSLSYLICIPSVLESCHSHLHLFEKAHLLTEKWTSMGGARETQSEILKMLWVLLLNPHHPFRFSHCSLSGFETLDTREEKMEVFGLELEKS